MIFETCNVIFGYKNLEQLQSSKFPVLLIEPRRNTIDLIRNKSDGSVTSITHLSNTKLIPRLLHTTITEQLLVFQDNTYTVNMINVNTSSNKHKREKVFTTTLLDVIKNYSIRTIKNFIVNLNIDYLSSILLSIEPYSHKIETIQIDKTINYCAAQDFMTKLYIPVSKDNSDYTCFEHVNIKTPLPRTCLLLIDAVPPNVREKLDMLVSRYNMTTMDASKLAKGDLQNLTIVLSEFYNHEKQQNTRHDTIVVLKPSFLQFVDTITLRYPLQDNHIIVHKGYDFIYSTKNCMYEVLNELQSDTFHKFIASKANNKKLFPFQYKKYMYSYLEQVFNVTDY